MLEILSKLVPTVPAFPVAHSGNINHIIQGAQNA